MGEWFAERPTESMCPPGCVEVQCMLCDWHFWMLASDPRIVRGPCVCPSCEGVDVGTKDGNDD